MKPLAYIENILLAVAFTLIVIFAPGNWKWISIFLLLFFNYRRGGNHD